MNLYQAYSEMLFAKAGSLGIPLSGTFELTARCNLSCKMCYIHKRANDALVGKREWSGERWLALAEECQRAGMLNLLLTGGEPLLRPDFKEIYTGCRKLGLMVSVNTNATLIDRDMVDFFAADPPARLNISLYGASAETYRALCGDGSAYDRVMWAIRALREAGILVKLNYTISDYNRQDSDAVYAFAREHDIAIQAAAYIFPPARACENGCGGFERMTPEAAAEALLAIERLRYSPEELRERWTDQLAGVRVENPDDECQELPTQRIRCRAGSSTFWITYDGQIRPCGMMPRPTADVDALGFDAGWAQIRAAREKILVPTRCTTCPVRHACDQCAAACITETGDFTGVPEYLCRMTEARLERIGRELRVGDAGEN